MHEISVGSAAAGRRGSLGIWREDNCTLPVLHCTEVSQQTDAKGHQQPPSFVTGAAGLAPIADELLTCARLSQSSRVSHANARQVLPSKRPCRPASVAPAMGQFRTLALQNVEPSLLTRQETRRTRAERDEPHPF